MLGKRICVGWNRLFLLLPVLILIPHLLPVKELHQQRDFGDVRNEKPKPKKLDHLSLGPAAGEGLPDRLQCQGMKALNRTQFRTVHSNSDSIDHVALVTVFTTYNSTVESRPIELVTVGNISYDKVERSMAILNVFLNFVQVTMPQSNVVILTDPASDLSLHRDMVTIQPIQGEYSRDKLMLQRIRSYIMFLETRLEKLKQKQEQVTHFIFTDSDIAVISDLGEIFSDYPNFDLALTFRNNKEQPLNSGFIAVRGTEDGIQRGKAFLQEVLKIYSSKFMNASRMLGDQLALAWVVRSNPSFAVRRFHSREAFQDKIGGATVLFLPCSSYNWTPPEGAGQFHGMPLDVKVVHFKGSRKRLMLEAWNYFSSSSDLPDMLCLILKSGRTKYDF
ncbi:polyphosphatidylinositol phosphatase [Perilla frutescens var. frutescens]|nr:polyphosphatidylinositol phosphatase [Perilla frutescens var. frutescens]